MICLKSSTSLHGEYGENLLDSAGDILYTLRGKEPIDIPMNVMIEFWLTSANYIAKIYIQTDPRGRYWLVEVICNNRTVYIEIQTACKMDN